MQGSAGFGIIETIAGAAVVGLAAYALTSVSNMISRESAREKKIPTMLALESNLGLTLQNQTNFNGAAKAGLAAGNTSTVVNLVGTDGITYAKTDKIQYWKADGSSCGDAQGSGCIISTQAALKAIPVGSTNMYLAYAIMDLSSGGQTVRSLGDLTSARWVIPTEFYLDPSALNCTSASLLLRGYDPRTGKPKCWDPPAPCKDGQIAKYLDFTDASSATTLHCVSLNTLNCNGANYAVQSFTPATFDPDFAPLPGGPRGTCVYYTLPSIPLPSSGICPANYTKVGSVCNLDSTHQPEVHQ